MWRQYTYYFPANSSTNPDVFSLKTFPIPRGIIPQNFSSLGFAVSEELGNIQTHHTPHTTHHTPHTKHHTPHTTHHTTPHHTPHHSTAQHSIAQHSTAQHSAAQHSAAQRSTHHTT